MGRFMSSVDTDDKPGLVSVLMPSLGTAVHQTCARIKPVLAPK